MDKNTKIGIIVIVAIVVLVGAYFLGKSSNNSNQPITTSSDNSLQTTPTSQEPTQNQNNTISEANNLNIASENGLACKNTAEAAASSDSINKSVTVIRTKYNQITNVCYYEVLINDGSDTEMDIRVAPDDNWIAYCAYTSTGAICNDRINSHQGLDTEQQFNQFEDYYFNN